MERLFIAAIITLLTFSCSFNDEPIEIAELITDAENPALQEEVWELVFLSGNIAGLPPLSGDDIPFDEYYTFSSDSAFVKTRQENGASRAAAGIFSITTVDDETRLELTYDEENDLIGNCTGDLIEVLFLRDYQLISTWNACDGPGLRYEKLE